MDRRQQIRVCALALISLLALSAAQASATLASHALWFEENRGQADSAVDYLARSSSYTAFLTDGDAVFNLYPNEVDSNQVQQLRLHFLNANRQLESAAAERLPGKSHYLRGRDPSRWQTHVPHYRSVRYANLYAGIDVAYHGRENLEYDLIVSPGADPKTITFVLEGVETTEIDTSGSLVVKLGDRRIVHRAPIAYQEIDGKRVQVASAFHLHPDGAIGFRMGSYDRAQTLTIDPLVLAYSTFIGGSANEDGNAVAVDAAGMAYVTGQTWSLDFPVSSGVFQTAQRSDRDAFVVKIDPGKNGAASLVYATYLGSSDRDWGMGITADDAGRAWVTGGVEGEDGGDFPVTPNGYKTSWTPGTDEADVFITALTADGSALHYSTLFGGTNDDWGHDLELVGNEIYFTGGTSGGNFPLAPSAAVNLDAGSGSTAFLAVLNPGTASLRFSTRIGGSWLDYSRGLAVDSSGRAHITGLARSDDFPTTPNAFMSSTPPGGTGNAARMPSFIAVIDPNQNDASALVYSSYLGAGSAEDIAVDGADNSYVTGYTSDPGFPTTAGAYDEVCDDYIHEYPDGTTENFGCMGTAYVMKFDTSQPGNSSLVYSTLIGSSRGRGIAVDSSGQAHVAGSASDGFPLTGEYSDVGGVALAKLNAAGSQLLYSTRLGGSASDAAKGIALESSGAVHITGYTSSDDFPIEGGFDTQITGQYSGDAFYAKLEFDACPEEDDPIELVQIDPSIEEDLEILLGHICIEWSGDIGGIGSIPRRCPPQPGCPECGPMMNGDAGVMPEALVDLYSYSEGLFHGQLTVESEAPVGPACRGFFCWLAKIFNPRPPDRTVAWVPTLHEHVIRLETGEHFDDKLRTNTAASLKALLESEQGKVSARHKVMKTLNAMELDWRTPKLTRHEIRAGKQIRLDLDGVAELRFSDVTKGGTTGLQVRSGAPALPQGYSLGWPQATLSFDFTGELAKGGRAEAELYTGWVTPIAPGSARLLEWDGKGYKDVTRETDRKNGRLNAWIRWDREYVVAYKIPCFLLELQKTPQFVNWAQRW